MSQERRRANVAAGEARVAGLASGRATEINSDRIDKWLFHARLCRTRVLAQEAAAAGRVRLNGTRIETPGHCVRPGDVLTLSLRGEIMTLRVLGLAERRGPATEARQLYEIVAD